MSTRLSLVDFLIELGQAAAQAQIAAVSEAVEVLLGQDVLDVVIPLGDEKIPVDGVALLPPGLPFLDNLVIECETEVDYIGGKKKEKGLIPELSMSLTKGLFSRGMHVKIKAEFRSGAGLEAVEILRERGREDGADAIEARLKAWPNPPD